MNHTSTLSRKLSGKGIAKTYSRKTARRARRAARTVRGRH